MWKKGLPGQAVSLIEFMSKNTLICTFYEEQLSDEGNVNNEVWPGNSWYFLCQGC